MNIHGGDIYSYKEKELLDFSSNINPLGVPKSFEISLLKNLMDFTRYPDINYVDLRISIARYLNIDKIESIILGNGAVEVIYKAIASLEIEKVVIAVPTFSEYKRAAQTQKIPVEEVLIYTDHGKVNLDPLVNVTITNSLVVLCNPNNPTGTLTDISSLRDLALRLQEKNSYLLVDEAFIEFTEGYPKTSMVSLTNQLPNLILIRAVTKYFGIPGIRLGYGVMGDENLVKKITEKMEPWNINTAAVLAGISVLHDEGYIERSRKWIEEERLFLFNELRGINGLTILPTQSNFLLAKHDYLTAQRLKELILEKDILIRTPEGFSGLTPNHFRLAIKNRSANIKLISALKEVTSSHPR